MLNLEDMSHAWIKKHLKISQKENILEINYRQMKINEYVNETLVKLRSLNGNHQKNEGVILLQTYMSA